MDVGRPRKIVHSIIAKQIDSGHDVRGIATVLVGVQALHGRVQTLFDGLTLRNTLPFYTFDKDLHSNG